MAIREVQQFACPVPAGTAKAVPAVFPCPLMGLDIEWIEWEVPPGARGAVGFVIASQGQPVIPYTTGAAPNWIVADGYTAHWDMDSLDASTGWEVRAYNLGINLHTIYVRFGLSMPPLAPGLAVPIGPDVSVLTS